MGHPLLDRGLPRELASRSQVIETKEILDSFSRLAGIVEADLASPGSGKTPQKWRQMPVAIRLRFGWADARQRFPALRGFVSTTIAAVCQRCLEPFELPLEVQLNFRLMPADAAAGPQEGYEDWELEEDTVRPLDIVEEALIMALPFAAMHEAGACSSTLQEQTSAEDAKMRHPFADLRSKMNDTN